MAEIGAGDSDGLQQEQAAGQTEAEEIVTEVLKCLYTQAIYILIAMYVC